jgi:hypothetical protein
MRLNTYIWQLETNMLAEHSRIESVICISILPSSLASVNNQWFEWPDISLLLRDFLEFAKKKQII